MSYSDIDATVTQRMCAAVMSVSFCEKCSIVVLGYRRIHYGWMGNMPLPPFWMCTNGDGVSQMTRTCTAV